MARVLCALVAILALATTACGGSAAPSGGAALRVTLSEFKFTPDRWEVSAGAPVKLELKNAGTVEHDFAVEQVAMKVHAPAGRTVEKTVGALAAGTYQVLCSIPGHKEAGMVGTLTVK